MASRKLTVGSLKATLPEQKEIQDTVPVPFPSKGKRHKQAKVEVMQNNTNYTIIPTQKKSSLLDTALEQGQMLSYKCKKGSCGKCTIKVLTGASCLEGVTKQERKMLKDNLELNYRLSCQAIVNCK